jgi:Domain of unknown function DUF29
MLAISSPPMTSLYDRDFYAWTETMAEALRSNNWSALDLEHLVEEMESLGRREQQELGNRLAILLGYLLKWQYQSPNAVTVGAQHCENSVGAFKSCSSIALVLRGLSYPTDTRRLKSWLHRQNPATWVERIS